METDEPYALKMGWFNSSNFLTPTCSALSRSVGTRRSRNSSSSLSRISP